MRWTIRLACLATMTVLFNGCQQVAWKPGAGAADLDRDTAACAAEHAEQPAVHDCLRKRGWVLRLPKAPAAEDEPGEVGEAAVATGAGVLPAASAGPVLPAADATATPARPAAEPGSGVVPAPRNKSVPKAVDPLRRSEIQAWWKMGGQGDALTADIDGCVAQLGPEHKPDLAKKLYTRGLIDCLKGRGWFGK